MLEVAQYSLGVSLPVQRTRLRLTARGVRCRAMSSDGLDEGANMLEEVGFGPGGVTSEMFSRPRWSVHKSTYHDRNTNGWIPNSRGIEEPLF